LDIISSFHFNNNINNKFDGEMGATSSTPKHEFLECQNDYELVIKASKELEYILEHHFGATGKGLHEKISSASPVLTLSRTCGI
jgi:hypothetical protein